MAIANPPITVLRSTQFGTEGYKRALEDILYQLWNKQGGASDPATGVSVAQTSLDYGEGDPGYSHISLISNDEIENIFMATTKEADYTALPFDFVNAKRGATITFPEYPAENDIIVIRNGDGSRIKINGNGRDINGSASGEIRLQGTSIEFYYFIDDNEWFAK